MEIVVWVAGFLATVITAAATGWISARFEHRRLREEMKLEYSIETAIRHLLENENYQRRSLAKIKRHLSGFKDDDALRMALIRAGAVAVSGAGESEMWGLLKRNLDEVK